MKQCPRCITGYLLADNRNTATCPCGYRVYGQHYSLCNVGDYVVRWEGKSKYCVVSSRKMMGVKLPWMPYTITVEDIEKYLAIL